MQSHSRYKRGDSRAWQLISEFLVESVKTLERLANPEQPPLSKAVIEKAHNDCVGGNMTVEDLAAKTEEMRKAFRKRGDPSMWKEDVLEKLDKCFRKHYLENGELKGIFLFPSAESISKFNVYYSDVDNIFKDNYDTVPTHTCTYFAYAMAWRAHGHPFPIPLGTASAVYALHRLTTKYKKGITEVS